MIAHMAINRSGTVFVQTGKTVREELDGKTEILPAEDPEAKKAKEQLQEVVEANKKLKNLAAQSRIICQVRSAFPFQLFPDELIVEADKLTVIHRTFAWKNIFPLPIDTLNNVNVTRALIFATLSFEIHGYEKNPDNIQYLWPSDAAKAKRCIMGLIGAHKAGIDLSKIPFEDLIKYLEEIGHTAGEIETLPMT